MKKICILGGDKRQIELFELLKNDYDVKLFGFEMQQFKKQDVLKYIKKTDILLLPIPLKFENSLILLRDKNMKISIDDILINIKKDCFVFYGGLNKQDDMIFENMPNSYNFLCDEEFLKCNASLTANAAITETMLELHMSYSDLTICVIGYGRIGKELVKLLNAFNAKVIICSTKNIIIDKDEELVHTSNAIYAMNKSDLVFNTAPCTIVENENIDNVNNSLKIRELSSKPYGFDIEYFKNAGYDIKVLPSLPGKVLYKSAAKIIYKKIIMLEKDNGINR